MLLNDQEVDCKQLLTCEVFFLKACDFTNLLADRTPLDEGLLVDLVDLDEDLGDLAQAEALRFQQQLQIAEEELLVELAEEEGKLGFARIQAVLQESVQRDFERETALHGTMHDKHGLNKHSLFFVIDIHNRSSLTVCAF